MAKDYSIWTVVLVAVVVALGTSLVTTSLTGSVITPGGTYDTQDRSLKVNGDLVLGSQAGIDGINRDLEFSPDNGGKGMQFDYYNGALYVGDLNTLSASNYVMKIGDDRNVMVNGNLSVNGNNVGEPSYLLSITGITQESGINYTHIKNVVTGQEVCVIKSGSDCKIGNIVLRTSNAEPNDDSVNLQIISGITSKPGYAYHVGSRYFTYNITRDDDLFIVTLK